jgi:hypothetical protein
MPSNSGKADLCSREIIDEANEFIKKITNNLSDYRSDKHGYTEASKLLRRLFLDERAKNSPQTTEIKNMRIKVLSEMGKRAYVSPEKIKHKTAKMNIQNKLSLFAEVMPCKTPGSAIEFVANKMYFEKTDNPDFFYSELIRIYQHPVIKPILDVLANKIQLSNKVSILIAENQQEICAYLSSRGGQYNCRNTVVVIKGAFSKTDMMSVLIHEISHFVMNILYNNFGLPYSSRNFSQKLEYDNAIKSLNTNLAAYKNDADQNRLAQNLFSDMACTEIDIIYSNSLYDEKNGGGRKDPEFIVLYPQLLVLTKNDDNEKNVLRIMQPLHDFYEKHLLPDAKRYSEKYTNMSTGKILEAYGIEDLDFIELAMKDAQVQSALEYLIKNYPTLLAKNILLLKKTEVTQAVNALSKADIAGKDIIRSAIKGVLFTDDFRSMVLSLALQSMLTQDCIVELTSVDKGELFTRQSTNNKQHSLFVTALEKLALLSQNNKVLIVKNVNNCRQNTDLIYVVAQAEKNFAIMFGDKDPILIRKYLALKGVKSEIQLAHDNQSWLVVVETESDKIVALSAPQKPESSNPNQEAVNFRRPISNHFFGERQKQRSDTEFVPFQIIPTIYKARRSAT